MVPIPENIVKKRESLLGPLFSNLISTSGYAYLMVISLPERTSVFSVRVLVEDT